MPVTSFETNQPTRYEEVIEVIGGESLHLSASSRRLLPPPNDTKPGFKRLDVDEKMAPSKTDRVAGDICVFDVVTRLVWCKTIKIENDV